MKKLSGNFLLGVLVLTMLASCDSGEKAKIGDDAVATTSQEASTEPTAQQPVPGLASPFSEDVLAIAIGGYCSLDAVNGNAVSDGKVELSRAVPAVMGGWATTLSGTVPNEPLLVIHNGSGRYAVKLATGISRPDVATALKNTALDKAGYESPAILKDIPAGTYDLSIVTPGDVHNRCPLNVVLTLAN